MKILLACPHFGNDLISNLASGMTAGTDDVVCHVGHKYFWNSPVEYDIVHIHWEEYLFGDSGKSAKAFARIEELKKSGAKTVLTRHNRFSHFGRTNADKQRAIEKLHGSLDGMIHMSKASHNEVAGNLASVNHQVILHPTYDNLPNDIAKADARKIMGIPEDAAVLLVFGMVRNRAEKAFALKCFDELDVANKFLLLPRWRLRVPKTMKKYLLSFKQGPDRRILDEFVPNEEIQLYFRSADVVLIPRVSRSNLNSGVVPLAIRFGTVVAGPDQGGIGENIRAIGCPTFQAEDSDSVLNAIKSGFELAATRDLPDTIIRFGEEQLSSKKIGQEHRLFYRKLMEGS